MGVSVMSASVKDEYRRTANDKPARGRQRARRVGALRQQGFDRLSPNGCVEPPLADIKPQPVGSGWQLAPRNALIGRCCRRRPAPTLGRKAAMKTLLIGLLSMLVSALSAAAGTDTLEAAPGSPRWDLQGNAKVAVYRGRQCLQLDGGAALLKDFELSDGVVDVDVATPAARGFFGIQFRLDDDGANG